MKSEPTHPTSFKKKSPKHKRFVMIVSILTCAGGVALFVGTAFRKNIRYFVTPSQLIQEKLHAQKHLRLGAVVKANSWKHQGLKHTFILTDGHYDIFVHHHGMLPDLFREGQTIVAEGIFKEGVFEARTVLAKHDENYRPPMPSTSPVTRKEYP